MSIALECSEDAVDERVVQVCELLRAEGVPEALLLELASKIAEQHDLAEH